MAVPDFQSWFLPLLKRLSDGEIHRVGDLYEELAGEFERAFLEEPQRVQVESPGAEQRGHGDSRKRAAPGPDEALGRTSHRS